MNIKQQDNNNRNICTHRNNYEKKLIDLQSELVGVRSEKGSLKKSMLRLTAEKEQQKLQITKLITEQTQSINDNRVLQHKLDSQLRLNSELWKRHDQEKTANEKQEANRRIHQISNCYRERQMEWMSASSINSSAGARILWFRCQVLKNLGMDLDDVKFEEILNNDKYREYRDARSNGQKYLPQECLWFSAKHQSGSEVLTQEQEESLPTIDDDFPLEIVHPSMWRKHSESWGMA